MQIRIDSFSFEDGYDFLKIYDGSSVSDGSIAELTGTYLNSLEYESTGRFLTLHMLSDSSVGKSGFFAEIEGMDRYDYMGLLLRVEETVKDKMF